jgi:hypothetical protein
MELLLELQDVSRFRRAEQLPAATLSAPIEYTCEGTTSRHNG